MASPAQATSIPLLDLPPGVFSLAGGVSDATAHGSFDWALPGPTSGWASGWMAGLVGGYDYATPGARASNTMGGVRIGRRMGGEWPFTWGLLLTGGANMVDSTQPLPKPTAQRFTSDLLLWAQPAIVFATRLGGDEKAWVRGSFGPVLGRFSEGAILMPWFVPNLEVAYRLTPSAELVVGGGYASPYGAGLRTAF